MLLVKTIVKSSPIAGVGLFADQDINEGEIVWQYTPETCIIFTEPQFQSLLNSYHKTERQLIQYYLTYSYYQKSMNGLIFCLDNSRFVNHADTPNLGAPSSSSTLAPGKHSIALRSIKKGEELTENYGSYDNSEWLMDTYKLYDICHFEQEREEQKVAS